MHVRSLEINNFRAISHAKLENLDGMVVIAGPNGCGKSCLFDAIRLFAAGYSGVEEKWFGEFHINLQASPTEFLPLLRDKTASATVRMSLTLEASEKLYIRSNLENLLRASLWSQFTGGRRELAFHVSGYRMGVAQVNAFGSQVEDQLPALSSAALQELDQDEFTGEVEINPVTGMRVSDSAVLQLVMSTKVPGEIGTFDYHSAQRNYPFEHVGSININIQSAESQYAQHSLFDVQGKYQNIKAHMASSYVRDLIASQAPEPTERKESLESTLKELFKLFFPDKAFMGPSASAKGQLDFLVTTSTGIKHDINDLSSGEKEVLYGYLRIRNVAPRRSVLLLDEPELHLNPRLVKGLPQFYHRHLGRELDSQIWILTHSDTLLKEAIGQEDFSVFQMVPAAEKTGAINQAVRVNEPGGIENLLIDLVGEVSSYLPGKKVVIFEGGGDTDFDLRLTLDLFPDFANQVVAVPGTNKGRVRELHELLQAASSRAALKERFYSIADRDSDVEDSNLVHAFTWDVYHIENYLLSPEFIRVVLTDLLRTKNRLHTDDDIIDALRDSARKTVGGLVRKELERWSHQLLWEAIRIGCDPGKPDPTAQIRASIEGSRTRFQKVVRSELSKSNLIRRETELRSRFERDLESDAWLKSMRGRDILKLFVRDFGQGESYERFSNLIIARMKDAGFEPPGMKEIITKILSD